MRSLASALILTERDAEDDENAPKVKGRIITTLPKAKEVRPLVERCVTIARKALKHQDTADEYATDADKHTEAWRTWRNSDSWRQWNEAIAPAVAARRRVLRLLGSKEAVSVLFDEIAPRFEARDGGYTRILRLAKPRLGDAGTRAILEFVGTRDRVRNVAMKPTFSDDDEAETRVPPSGEEAEEVVSEEPAAVAADTETPVPEGTEEDSADDQETRPAQ